MNKDLNVESYSVEDLMKLFKITYNDSEDDVILIINKLVQSLDRKDKKLLLFIKKAEYKILHYIQQKKKNRHLETTSLEKSQIESSNHAVIKPPKTPVQFTYDYKFTKGDINPIEKRTITRVICLDTNYRENILTTNPSDVKWKLPYKIKNVVSMKLISLQMPIIYYMFSDTQKTNRFTIHLYNMMYKGASYYPDKIIEVVIPEGNYLADIFITAMNNYFNNLKGGLEYLCIDLNYITGSIIFRTKDVNDSANKVLAYKPENDYYSPDFYFKVDFGTGVDTMGKMMGFSKPTYTVTGNDRYTNNIALNTTPINYYCYLTGENMYGSNIMNYIFIDVDDYNNNYVTNSITSVIKNSFLGNNILARITITSNSNSILDVNGYDKIYKQRDYFGPVDIEKLHIRILDKNGVLLDINKNNYSLAFEFTCLYNHP